MRYHALAADYDGTLAHHGRVDDATWAALRRLRESGRKLVMVTGRELDDLIRIVPEPELFDRIVAENGAIVYEPKTRDVRTPYPAPAPAFVDELRRRGVAPLAVGRVIVATREPHHDTALRVIRDLGLELQVIFNKGAVMILPTGVNKATGLAAALGELELSARNVVAVGDAENDHALLDSSECGVAVANALPVLKARADLVTAADHGAGVVELVDRLLANDLADVTPRRSRQIVVGNAGDREITIDPYATTLLVCGTSGGGKTVLTSGLVERLGDAGYQLAIIDPEGDYAESERAIVLGSIKRAPLVDEVLDVLRDPSRAVVANLLGVPLDHRPEFYAQLASALAELRARTGRPHWMVIDEAHHLLPVAYQAGAELPHRAHGSLYVTVDVQSVAPAALATITAMLAIGDRPDLRVRELCAAAGHPPPELAPIERLSGGDALWWRIGEPPIVIHCDAAKLERTRHARKYIEGHLGSDRAFVFRGPEGKLKLKAHNLLLFVSIGDGVDDDTWR